MYKNDCNAEMVKGTQSSQVLPACGKVATTSLSVLMLCSSSCCDNSVRPWQREALAVAAIVLHPLTVITHMSNPWQTLQIKGSYAMSFPFSEK